MSPLSAEFSKAAPSDSVFTVTPAGIVTLSQLKIGASTVNSANYTYAENVLTIGATYLGTLANGIKTFTLVMSDGGDMTVTVTVAD